MRKPSAEGISDSIASHTSAGPVGRRGLLRHAMNCQVGGVLLQPVTEESILTAIAQQDGDEAPTGVIDMIHIFS
jgi:hypothetical protein